MDYFSTPLVELHGVFADGHADPIREGFDSPGAGSGQIRGGDVGWPGPG
jgi:hypothetical protein